MNVTPIADRIVVQRVSAEQKTAGGIVLPDAAKNKPQRGKVLAVGPGKLLKDGSRRAPQLRKGDEVIFTNWAGEEYRETTTDDEILLMREEEVLAVIE